MKEVPKLTKLFVFQVGTTLPNFDINHANHHSKEEVVEPKFLSSRWFQQRLIRTWTPEVTASEIANWMIETGDRVTQEVRTNEDGGLDWTGLPEPM